MPWTISTMPRKRPEVTSGWTSLRLLNTAASGGATAAPMRMPTTSPTNDGPTQLIPRRKPETRAATMRRMTMPSSRSTADSLAAAGAAAPIVIAPVGASARMLRGRRGVAQPGSAPALGGAGMRGGRDNEVDGSAPISPKRGANPAHSNGRHEGHEHAPTQRARRSPVLSALRFTMRGTTTHQATMLSTLTTDSLIPMDHPIRRIKPVVEAVLAELAPEFDAMYARTGRQTPLSGGLGVQRRPRPLQAGPPRRGRLRRWRHHRFHRRP